MHMVRHPLITSFLARILTTPIPKPGNPLELIQPDMARVDVVIHERLTTEVPLVREVAQYIISAGGKRLRLIEPGPDGRALLRAEPVANVPAVLARGQAGLFDVVVDPAFAVNGRVMLSFAHGKPEANHLRVVRGRFDGRQLLDVQPVFTSQPAKAETQHFSGRMAWLAD
eukprot:gene25678-46770_t